MRRRLSVAMLVAVACGGGEGARPEADGPAPDSDGPVGVDAPDAAPAPVSCSTATPGSPFVMMSGLPEYGVRFIVSGDEVFVMSGTSSTQADGALHALPRDGGAATLLAGELLRPRDLAADDTHVYAITEEAARPIVRVPRGGGVLANVLSGSSRVDDLAAANGTVYVSTGEGEIVAIDAETGKSTVLVDERLFGVSGMRVEGDHLYYLNAQGRFGSSVERIARAGGAVEMVAINQRSAHALALRNGRAAWLLGEPSAVVTRAATEGPRVIWQSNQAKDMVQRDGRFYWLSADAVAEYDPAIGQSTTLVSGLFHSFHTLAIDDTHIYLVQQTHEDPAFDIFTPGAIHRMPRDGSAPMAQIAGDQWSVQAIEDDDTHVYWVTRGPWPSYQGQVVRYDKASGAVQVVASGQPDARGLALDDTYVYWFSAHDRALMRVAKSGGTPVALATQVSQNPTDMVRDDDGTLYWSDTSGSVLAYRDGAVTAIEGGPFSPGQPLIVGDQLYFPARMHADLRDVIYTRPLVGGALRMIASDLGGPSSLLVHADRIYWVDFFAHIALSAPLSGAAADVVAGDVGFAADLDLTDDTAYWSGVDGVWRQRLDGSAAERVVEIQGVTGVDLSGDTLYWSAGESLFCASVAGS